MTGGFKKCRYQIADGCHNSGPYYGDPATNPEAVPIPVLRYVP